MNQIKSYLKGYSKALKDKSLGQLRKQAIFLGLKIKKVKKQSLVDHIVKALNDDPDKVKSLMKSEDKVNQTNSTEQTVEKNELQSKNLDKNVKNSENNSMINYLSNVNKKHEKQKRKKQKSFLENDINKEKVQQEISRSFFLLRNFAIRSEYAFMFSDYYDYNLPKHLIREGLQKKGRKQVRKIIEDHLPKNLKAFYEPVKTIEQATTIYQILKQVKFEKRMKDPLEDCFIKNNHSHIQSKFNVVNIFKKKNYYENYLSEENKKLFKLFLGKFHDKRVEQIHKTIWILTLFPQQREKTQITLKKCIQDLSSKKINQTNDIYLILDSLKMILFDLNFENLDIENLLKEVLDSIQNTQIKQFFKADELIVSNILQIFCDIFQGEEEVKLNVIEKCLQIFMKLSKKNKKVASKFIKFLNHRESFQHLQKQVIKQLVSFMTFTLEQLYEAVQLVVDYEYFGGIEALIVSNICQEDIKKMDLKTAQLIKQSIVKGKQYVEMKSDQLNQIENFLDEKISNLK